MMDRNQAIEPAIIIQLRALVQFIFHLYNAILDFRRRSRPIAAIAILVIMVIGIYNGCNKRVSKVTIDLVQPKVSIDFETDSQVLELSQAAVNATTEQYCMKPSFLPITTCPVPEQSMVTNLTVPQQELPASITLDGANNRNNTEFFQSMNHAFSQDGYPAQQMQDFISNLVRSARNETDRILKDIDAELPELRVTEYKYIVLPLLQNRSSAWNPIDVKYIDQIEAVQRDFLNAVLPRTGMTYVEKLKQYDLETLEMQRLRTILIRTFETVHHLNDADKHDMFQLTTCKTEGGHNFKLSTKPRISNSKAFAFADRACRMWNKLPVDRVDFSTVDTFKYTLTAEVMQPFCKSELK